jgi:hypothetical protein
MNAAASAMNSYHKGEQDKFELAQKQWENNLEWALHENEVQSEKYKEIIENKQLSINEKEVGIKALTDLYGDKVTQQELRTKGYDAAVENINRRVELGFKLSEQYDKHLINETKVQQASTGKIDWSIYNDDDIVPGTGRTFAAIKKEAQYLHESGAAYIPGLGRSDSPARKAIDNYRAFAYPDDNIAKIAQDYKAATKELINATSGKDAQTVQSFNVAYSHIDLVENLAKALHNGDNQLINKYSNAYERAFGDPAPTNFDTAKNILADEVTKAVIGSGGTLTDREGTGETIVNSSSPYQFEGALGVFKGLIIGQVGGIKRKYETATKRNDFNDFLSPEVKKDLERKTTPSEGDIAYLKGHDDEAHIKAFDAQYGEGAAKKALEK